MHYDVIVIGAGHAGCEAAAAAARMGAQVLLVTPDPTNLGAMSCNPAIGGVGKGHLVRELDVFDGLMARAADRAGIHYRMLNRSKGSAVHGPRVQADRRLYRRAITQAIGAQTRLTVENGTVERLLIRSGTVSGVVLADGETRTCRAVVLATGTFLAGRLFCGSERTPGGRADEAPATTLAEQLRGLALPMGRLKTGTPPRLDGRSIDWGRLARQPSDNETWTFSPLGPGRAAPQVACGVTRTNAVTHEIIRSGLGQSPLRSGDIEGRGPRYCPSIEDKVERFGDRDGHQIFLEPESLTDALVYPNGISTSLPPEVQQAMVRSIDGLHRAEIVRPGYAVEYDYLDPRSLDARLALKALPGLFCAGQINGTTGYEEAAAQGLVAGLNAAAAALGAEAIRFDRTTSYIGVMIDDLTLQGVTEPYRMLTARAEHRLALRADNAASRLGRMARASGAIGAERRAWLDRQDAMVADARTALSRRPSTDSLTMAELALRGSFGVAEAITLAPELGDIASVLEEVLADARYAPYLDRQRAEAARVRADEELSLRKIESYHRIAGLSTEMVERLEAARPETLGAAGRIRGITPAALTAVLLAARVAA